MWQSKLFTLKSPIWMCRCVQWENDLLPKYERNEDHEIGEWKGTDEHCIVEQCCCVFWSFDFEHSMDLRAKCLYKIPFFECTWRVSKQIKIFKINRNSIYRIKINIRPREREKNQIPLILHANKEYLFKTHVLIQFWVVSIKKNSQIYLFSISYFSLLRHRGFIYTLLQSKVLRTTTRYRYVWLCINMCSNSNATHVQVVYNIVRHILIMIIIQRIERIFIHFFVFKKKSAPKIMKFLWIDFNRKFSKPKKRANKFSVKCHYDNHMFSPFKAQSNCWAIAIVHFVRPFLFVIISSRIS